MTDDPIPEAELVEMHYDKNGLNFTMKHPIIPTIAEHLAEAFKAAGGINFVSFEIDHTDLGPLELVMQRRWGKTPANMAHRYRIALERVRDEGAPAKFENIAREALDGKH